MAKYWEMYKEKNRIIDKQTYMNQLESKLDQAAKSNIFI